MRVLILSNDHLYANIALKRFLEQNHQGIVGLIMPDFIIPGKSFLESVRFLLKKSFFRFIVYKWFEEQIYKLKLALGLGRLKPFPYYAKKYNFPLLKISDVNSEEAMAIIRRLRPDVIYSVAYPQKIGAAVLRIPKHGCINFHDSILPKYRGLCAYFWVVANNEKKSGVTAIYIEEGLDAGKILLQRELTINQDDSIQKVYFNNAKLMAKMIFEIQCKLDNNQIMPRDQKKPGGSYYSWPNQDGYLMFKKNKRKFFRFNELWGSI